MNYNGILSIDHYTGLQSQIFNIYIKGDINGDGAIDSSDITMLQQYLSGYISLTTVQKYCADFDMSGFVTLQDISALQNYLNIGTVFRSNPTNEDDILYGTGINVFTEREMLEMSSEEFLEFLFGDIDYSLLRIELFD